MKSEVAKNMKLNITKNDIIWSYSSQIFQISSNVFLLPIILNRLSSDDLGIWYIFLSIVALINLFDFGLQPTIIRNVSYIYAGAKELKSVGFSLIKSKSLIDYALLKSLIESAKKIYKLISLFTILFLSTLGTLYISSIIKLNNIIIISWVLIIFSTGLNFYYSYYNSLLIGRGLIKKAHKIIVFTKLVYLIIASIGILSGFGLVSIALATIISTFMNRFLSRKSYYDIETKIALESIKIKSKFELNILLKNSINSCLVSLGVFLSISSNQLIGSTFIDLSTMASFGLSIQIYTLLQTTSRVLFQTYLPQMNMLRLTNDVDKLKKFFVNSMIINYLTYIIGSILIIILGNNILELL